MISEFLQDVGEESEFDEDDSNFIIWENSIAKAIEVDCFREKAEYANKAIAADGFGYEYGYNNTTIPELQIGWLPKNFLDRRHLEHDDDECGTVMISSSGECIFYDYELQKYIYSAHPPEDFEKTEDGFWISFSRLHKG